MKKNPTVPRYFSERSDQSILLSTIRECLYFKLPQGSRKFIYAYVFLSCLYLKFLPLVYSNVFDVIRGLFECTVHCYLESWPQTGKFDFFSPLNLKTFMPLAHYLLIRWVCFQYLACIQHRARSWENNVKQSVCDWCLLYFQFSGTDRQSHKQSWGKYRSCKP